MHPDINFLTIDEQKALFEAIKVIDDNAQGICFVVDSNKKLTGVLTDGDIRRALLHGYNLNARIKDVMNRALTVMSIEATAEEINSKLNNKIRHIPLTDSEGRLVDYASRFRTRRIPIMQPSLGGNELKYVIDCVQTGWISSQGAYVKQFEKKFEEYTGAQYALAVSNGTTALHLALVSLGIGPGDEVIVPDFTFAASINAVLYTGANPVLVDVDMETWTIDVDSLQAAITPNTKAIMPVHIYGHPCDMDSIMQIANQNNLYVIEDCAEALGSLYKGKPVGTFGHVSAFSFFGNKTITTGEGGMLIFNEKAIYDHATVLRDHGMSKQKRYWHDYIGYNYRMTNLQAAIGVAQMERIAEIVDTKYKIAKHYNSALSKLSGLQLHGEKGMVRNSYWLYTILVKPGFGFDRDELIDRLAKNGIETRPAFYPLHEMPLYAQFRGNRKLSNSKFISDNGLSLPSYVDLKEEELINIIKSLEAAFSVKSIHSELT